MVKAVRVHATGGPEVMKIEDIELAAPGPGEIRVRNESIGLNFIDIYFRSGVYPPASLPFTPGNEGAGTVLALGKGVKGFKVGDKVAYVATLGSYAAERNVPAASVVHIPAGVTTDQAAAMMLKGLTAEYLLFRSFPVKKGSVILVHAAAGGVGQILCQWGKALGCTVIGTVGSKDKAKVAKKAGAHHVILYRDEDFAARVAEITKGKKCDVVYDGVGKDTFPKSLDCLRPHGTFVSFGNASGTIDAFNIGILGGKGSLYATRPTLFTFIGVRKTYEEMAKRMFDAIKKKKIKIPLTKKWKLDDVVKAHEALAGRQTVGSMVLKP
ncbi:MAG: quinone oxidoreductase family protein [Beijerinckiaceae bacterium]